MGNNDWFGSFMEVSYWLYPSSIWFLLLWLPVWGTGNKCRARNLTVIWQVLENESFNWLTETIAHIINAFHWKQNLDANLPCWKSLVGHSLANVTLESFKNWTLCLARSRFHLSFVGLWKKHCKWPRSSLRWSGAGMFANICWRNHLFSLISNLCLSIVNCYC